MHQSEFIASVCDPQRAVPAFVTSRANSHDKRFSVYRNNVIVNLIEVLEGGFPLVRKIVGEEFFRAMAGVFVRLHPPNSPILSLFGDELPSFLETFEPVQGLPYLADVARMELGLRRSYHAADHDPAPARALSELTPETIAEARLETAPSFMLLRSRYPIYGIWLANTGGNRKPHHGPEDVAIIRKGFDPEPRLLAEGEFEFLQALEGGATLGDAFECAIEAGDGFGLDESLTWLLGSDAIVSVQAG